MSKESNHWSGCKKGHCVECNSNSWSSRHALMHRCPRLAPSKNTHILPLLGKQPQSFFSLRFSLWPLTYVYTDIYRKPLRRKVHNCCSRAALSMLQSRHRSQTVFFLHGLVARPLNMGSYFSIHTTKKKRNSG